MMTHGGNIGIEQDKLDEISRLLEKASDKVVQSMNTLLHSFVTKAKEAKSDLAKVSEAIVKASRSCLKLKI